MTAATAVIRGLGGNGSTFPARAIAALPDTLLRNECNPRIAGPFEYRLNPLRQRAGSEPALAAALLAAMPGGGAADPA